LALTLYDCSNFTTNQTSTLQDSQVQTSCYQAEIDYELHYMPVVELSHHLIVEPTKVAVSALSQQLEQLASSGCAGAVTL
jgi:hypothetical protein